MVQRYASPLVLLTVLAGCIGGSPDSIPDASAPAILEPPSEFVISDASYRAFEPIAARHPTDPDAALVVSTVFRDDDADGYPSWFNVHRTSNRGADWTTYPLQASLPPEDPVALYTILADPMLTWLDDGTLLLFGMGGTGFMPRDGPAPGAGFTAFDIWMLASIDGGASWGPGQVIAEGQGFQSAISAGYYYDQPFVARGVGATAVLAWVQQVIAPNQTETGNVLAAITKDGGKTWSNPSVVDEGGKLHNARPVLLGNGNIVVAYRDVFDGYGPGPLFVKTSVDGENWSGRSLVTQKASRPMMASDGTSIWLTYGNEDGLVLQESNDVARSWNVTTLAPLEPYWDPLVMVSSAQSPIVTWYEGGDGDRRYMVWDGKPQQISTSRIGPMTAVGVLGWNSLGDYMGLDVRTDGGIAAWITGQGSGQNVVGAWID